MNTFPTIPSTRRLAIVSETSHGGSGYLNDSLLASAGIDRATCFFGYVSPRPGLKFDSAEVQASLGELKADLRTFKPHFVLLLDRFGLALRAFRGDRLSVDDVRGYLFESDFIGDKLECDCDALERGSATGALKDGSWDCNVCQDTGWRQVKCLATYHPSRLQMEYGLTGVARFDYQKAARELKTDTLNYPVRVIDVDLSKEQLLDKLANLRTNPLLTHLDIEGGCGYGTACIGFSTEPSYAFVVPFYGVDGISIWSEEDEVELWEAVAGVLQAPTVPKCIMNALYEGFVLLWTLGIVIVNLTDDLMLSHYEMYAELEKALEFQASIYTNQPYWKLEHKRDKATGRYVPFRGGKPVTTREWFIYNGTDCCVTCECHNTILPKLKPKQLEHYRFNVSLLMPLLYMEARGIKYDKAAAVRRLTEVQQQIYEKQDEINREASSSRPSLAAFYSSLQRGEAVTNTNPEHISGTAVDKSLHDINPLVPIFADAFCKARCTESREVEETTWQPCRWNGKKWVKAGKQVERWPEDQVGDWIADSEPLTDFDKSKKWWKRKGKTITRNIPVKIRTFEDVQRFSKDSCAISCQAAIKLAGTLREHRQSEGRVALAGQLATLLDLHIKINATNAGGDAQWYLYEHCQLPKQYQKDGNKLTDKLATDDEAVIKAWVASKDPRALTFLELRRLVTTTKYLTASPDDDGRLRFALNLVATPTGRMAGYGSPTGSSDINPQTIGKGIRDLFPADSEDHLLGQFDLDGSDSWTVAAYAASLGDTTMLSDNLARLKPAKILACIYEHGPDINNLNRDQLRTECKKVDGEGWLYFACKRVLHGSNYGMGKVTMANQILTDSYKLLGKPVHLDGATCERIQKQAFFVRYPGVLSWHAWMKRELKEKGVLVCCNGFQRRFYGRKDDHATLKEALAHMPQVLTTAGITTTLAKLWRDPENRNPDGSFKVEALLCVHDSLIMQWHKRDTEWARDKIKSWFKQEMTVNGINFHIPVNGTAGPNWKYQGSEKYAEQGGIDL